VINVLAVVIAYDRGARQKPIEATSTSGAAGTKYRYAKRYFASARRLMSSVAGKRDFNSPYFAAASITGCTRSGVMSTPYNTARRCFDVCDPLLNVRREHQCRFVRMRVRQMAASFIAATNLRAASDFW